MTNTIIIPSIMFGPNEVAYEYSDGTYALNFLNLETQKQETLTLEQFQEKFADKSKSDWYHNRVANFMYAINEFRRRKVTG